MDICYKYGQPTIEYIRSMLYHRYVNGNNSREFVSKPMKNVFVFVSEPMKNVIGSRSVNKFSTDALYTLKGVCRRNKQLVSTFLEMVSNGTTPMMFETMKGLVLAELRRRKAVHQQNSRAVVNMQGKWSSCKGGSSVSSVNSACLRRR
jgi:hypothetical protein